MQQPERTLTRVQAEVDNLSRALDAAVTRRRAVIRVLADSGWTYQRIADRAGISITSVWRAIHNGGATNAH
ncbi:helix-turn-helix domain-containing protein [Mycolicibacter icosiumassiliensis]|uniref:helix-turn-helix domain-containing protein n=1 Tax=Mycolicibacter icosiumassiliensis TaxID=1792835 RepID=UPI000829DFD7|nr:helix-turn-helix domain-containing protein [Mycolicibacter icosiumassiliensis]